MVCLTEAVLIRFGKFKNCSLQFQPGLHVLYGENEAGKSTLQLFLKAMLYGAAARKKTDEALKERERMIPWGEKSAEGILRLRFDGREAEIRRRFGKTASGDKTEILDLHTGEALEGFPTDAIGEKLFGVEASVFEKTFWIRQDGVIFAGKDQDLNRRLMNLYASGDEEISADHALAALEKQKRAINTTDKRSAPGRLNVLYSERSTALEELSQARAEIEKWETEEQTLKAAETRLCEIEKEMQALERESKAQERLKNMETRLQKWKQAEILLQKENEAKARPEYKKYISLDEAQVLQAEELERVIKTLDQNAEIGYDKESAEKTAADAKRKSQTGLLLVIAGSAVVIFGIILAAYRHLALAGGTALIGLLIVLGGIWWYFRCKEHKLEALRKIYACETEIENTRKTREEHSKKLEEILRQFACKNTAELRSGMMQCRKAVLETESFHSARCALLEAEDEERLQKDAEEAMELLKKDAGLLQKDIAGYISRLQQEKTDTAVRVSALKTQLAAASQNQKKPADIASRLQFIEEDIKAEKKLLSAVEMALEVFQDTVQKRKSDFAPQIHEKVSQYLDILTSGKYQEARVSDEYRMQVAPDSTALYASEYFSFGTRQQLYFALRLALGSLIGQGNEPLFLDDFLTAYDDVRAEAAIILLKQIAEKRQIILFTCHSRDVEYAAKAGAAISHLEEEIVNVC